MRRDAPGRPKTGYGEQENPKWSASRPSGREQDELECPLPEGGAPEIPEIPCAAEHVLGGGGGEARGGEGGSEEEA